MKGSIVVPLNVRSRLTAYIPTGSWVNAAYLHGQVQDLSVSILPFLTTDDAGLFSQDPEDALLPIRAGTLFRLPDFNGLTGCT